LKYLWFYRPWKELINKLGVPKKILREYNLVHLNMNLDMIQSFLVNNLL